MVLFLLLDFTENINALNKIKNSHHAIDTET